MSTISPGYKPHHFVWILGPRFSYWQAYHTPKGYAATNNPLETYHYTLKLVNDSKRSTHTEVVARLDLSRIAYVASMGPFIDVPQVSKRLKSLYRKAEKKKMMKHRLCTYGLE
ncbi:hypothetical protein GQ600_20510 [Phytophthora cactorum]|nr:hypothetical protein GQ600_20510 [Phytophthora cactorum]